MFFIVLKISPSFRAELNFSDASLKLFDCLRKFISLSLRLLFKKFLIDVIRFVLIVLNDTEK